MPKLTAKMLRAAQSLGTRKTKTSDDGRREGNAKRNNVIASARALHGGSFHWRPDAMATLATKGYKAYNKKKSAHQRMYAGMALEQHDRNLRSKATGRRKSKSNRGIL